MAVDVSLANKAIYNCLINVTILLTTNEIVMENKQWNWKVKEIGNTHGSLDFNRIQTT